MISANRSDTSHARSPHVAIPIAPEKSWALQEQTVLETLGVDREIGLTWAQVRRRHHLFGPNRLRETKRRSSWRLLWDQVANPIVLLLATATVVALVFDEQLEAVAIAVVLVVNSAIGFWTERRAIRAVEALRDLGCIHATVRREGRIQVVPAEELVPGDVVLLDAGDVLTADLRIVTASRLQVNESALTGESLAIDKASTPCAPEAALSDRSSMLFKGTAVTRGSAEAVVVATGMETELGQISRLVESAEPEVTPLEARLDQLGRRLIVLTIAITTFVAAASIWSGRDLYLSIEIALALAVAAVPEGLPIVATVALARGMWRMARRNALVEQLSAVETLGSTTLLLVDKTGTLTENRMAVSELSLPDETMTTLESMDDGKRAFLRDGVQFIPTESPLLASALRVAALCNNAELAADAAGEAGGVGDPTEVALLLAARAAGLEREILLAAAPEIREVAFDPDAKRMATLHLVEDAGILAAVKGAPEAILPSCTHRASADGSACEFDDVGRARWLSNAEEMAARGQRVLALATRNLTDPETFSYENLTFAGLIALLDPPRAGVADTIAACRAAGIHVVMATGDHGGTAWRIAAMTGLITPQEGESIAFIDAGAIPEIAALSWDDVQDILRTPVIARATPKQKLDFIALFQRHGAVVAMTGDGVNDAPALKKADIGVAMGKHGTQVAREAADMVLQDDELKTIVTAIGQGRAIFENIRKFVVYLLSCNLSEILAVTAASLAQIPLPLMPLQILFLNLVTDVFPALALGVGEGAPTLMQEAPRPPDEPLITRRHWFRISAFGATIALAVLGALMIATELQGRSAREATTISFMTLALAQLWHVFNMRDRRSGTWNNEITRNGWIWAALLLCIGLIALAVHWPPLASILSVTDPGIGGWVVALTMSLLPLAVGQVWLVIRGYFARGAADDIVR